MAKISAHCSLLVSLFFLVGCDHATKGLAKEGLEGGGAHELIEGVVQLRYVENTDIAFNLLRWVPETIRGPGLLVLGAVALLALGALLYRGRGDLRLRRLALVLITAGAIGNYVDRALRGYAVDFVHLRHWPVFNVADVYITAGYVLFGLALLRHRRERAVPPPDLGRA